MPRLIITLAGAALGVLVASADAQELRSLRGPTAIDETATAPDVYRVDESGRVERNYRQQPPLIPHRTDKYQIDIKLNQCLRCHDWPGNVESGAPKISETHYVDRNGVALDQVARTRWFCNQCHVPQANAPPLVRNTFEPAKLKH
jgi:cytochrome c-type protein NapB